MQEKEKPSKRRHTREEQMLENYDLVEDLKDRLTMLVYSWPETLEASKMFEEGGLNIEATRNGIPFGYRQYAYKVTEKQILVEGVRITFSQNQVIYGIEFETSDTFSRKPYSSAIRYHEEPKQDNNEEQDVIIRKAFQSGIKRKDETEELKILTINSEGISLANKMLSILESA